MSAHSIASSAAWAVAVGAPAEPEHGGGRGTRPWPRRSGRSPPQVTRRALPLQPTDPRDRDRHTPVDFSVGRLELGRGVDQSVLLDDDRCDISGSRSRRGSAVCTGRLRREGEELHGGPARRGSDREWPTTAASSPGLVYQRENLSGSDHLSTGRRHERPNNPTSPARLLSWRPAAGRQLRARHSCERDSRRE
jgi:hypothetical protein